MELSRRDLLKLGFFGSAALMLPAERIARTQLAIADRIPASRLPQPFTVPFAVPPVATPVARTADTDLYSLAQIEAPVEILPGLKTPIWGYNGITPGPTIVVPQGRKTLVRQLCDLPAVHPTLRYNVWTSTHLHGSASLPEYDGYASDFTNPGEFKDYQYPNFQNARTLWYHDHGVHITAPNAYMGLAAMYILHDPHELSLPIPHGPYDVPLVVKDAMFTSSGELIFDDNGGTGGGSGMFGDVILVNGRPWPAMPVERRKYRFRLLNASISRSYRLALSTGDPFTVIGTDGGLMPAPAETTSLRFGMAERYEIVIDFAKYPIGTRVVLQNLGLPNNIDFATTGVVMAFDVTADATDTEQQHGPARPQPGQRGDAPHREPGGDDAHDGVQAPGRRVDGQRADVGGRHQQRLHAGRRAPEARRRRDLGAQEQLGRVVPPGPHPPRRLPDPGPQRPAAASVRARPQGRRYVGEGETVRVLMRFGPQVGRYMMHCHNLVHEDHDMMVQFEVGTGGDDPIERDRPKRQPAPELHGDEPASGGSDSGSGGGRRLRSGPGAGTGAGAGARQARQRQAEAQAEAQGQGQGQEEAPPQAEAQAEAEAEGQAQAERAQARDGALGHGRRHGPPSPCARSPRAGPHPASPPPSRPRRCRSRWHGFTSPMSPRICGSGGRTVRSSSPPASGQALFAPLVLRRPAPWVAAVGIAGNLAIVAMYVLSRTAGPPLGPHAQRPRAGRPDRPRDNRRGDRARRGPPDAARRPEPPRGP